MVKKSILLFILILLFIQPFLIAVDNLPNPQDLKQASDQAIQVTGTGNINNEANSILQEEISIPSNIQNYVRIIFGIKTNENINLQFLIVLITLWVMFIILLYNLILIIPFFGEGWKSWAVSAIITLLISISGVITSAALFILDFSWLFKESSLLKLIIIVPILLIITWGLSKLIGLLKDSTKKQEAKMAGLRTGSQGIIE